MKRKFKHGTEPTMKVEGERGPRFQIFDLDKNHYQEERSFTHLFAWVRKCAMTARVS
jgi:hypothetical protein